MTPREELIELFELYGTELSHNGYASALEYADKVLAKYVRRNNLMPDNVHVGDQVIVFTGMGDYEIGVIQEIKDSSILLLPEGWKSPAWYSTTNLRLWNGNIDADTSGHSRLRKDRPRHT